MNMQRDDFMQIYLCLLYVDVNFVPLIVKGVAGPGNHQVLLVALPEMVKFY